MSTSLSAPPQMSSIIVRIGSPIGTSTNWEFFTLPVTAKTLVPFDFSVPLLEYHSAPFSKIGDTAANVSTLFMDVGLPQSPLTDGYGGRGIGDPRLPSIEAINAVSSPHTKAPAPRRISASKQKPDPRILSPNNPFSRAC